MLNKKKALRKEFLALRNASPEKELSLSQLEEFAEFKNAKTIFCYVSAGSEVKTHFLIEKMLKEKRVVVPYCTDKEGNMIAVEIKSLDDLKEGLFGIAEPVSPIEFSKEKIDFAIVPAIAFDKNGYRLGYGKGYYDKFLSDITPYKLGVCKSELYVEELPHDELDVKMDKVIVL